MQRKLLGKMVYLLAAGLIPLLASSASAFPFAYSSAEIDVFNSSNALIATVSVSAPAATNGTLYEIATAGLANSIQFGNASALSTGGSAAGPYFVTFGVIDNGGGDFHLGFSWDLSGNDPYGSFANNFFNYDNPPVQATYTYSMTAYLSNAALSAGDTASLVLHAVPVPEPASMALLATGGFMLTIGRLRRRKN